MTGEKNIQENSIDLQKLRRVYFVGIGGIGMSALARYFRSTGIAVSGYDKTPTALTAQLQEEGIEIVFDDDASMVPKDADLVIYTPAVPRDHAGLNFYRENNFPVVKRSDALQAITKGGFNICIAGTHGKTTITAMTAHILRHSGHGCTALMGGISVNYDTNFWAASNKVFVVEADEYDRSFLKLDPSIAVITAMDADHLDIYGDELSMQDAFVSFGNRLKGDGLLISRFGLLRTREIKAGNKYSYSLQNTAADIFATEIQMKEGGYQYNVSLPSGEIKGLELKVGGMHNVENSLVAIGIADALGIDGALIAESIKTFRGVKRRFEYILPPTKTSGSTYVQPVLVDDYAHHPEELRALLTSVKSLFPQRLITVIFQPHLFTRTRDLADGFAKALSIADRVVLLPIYPAREEPIEGVSSDLIIGSVASPVKEVLQKDELENWVKKQVKLLDKEFGEVYVMAGAGDIDLLVPSIKTILEKGFE